MKPLMTFDPCAADLVVLSFDGVRLAFVQGDVVATEVAAAVRRDAAADAPLGLLVHDGRQWPVHGLSEAFAPLADLPRRRRFCVCLESRTPPVAFALACDEVARLRLPEETLFQPLPECLRRPATPIRFLLRQDGGLLCASTAAAMGAYLNVRQETDE